MGKLGTVLGVLVFVVFTSGFDGGHSANATSPSSSAEFAPESALFAPAAKCGEAVPAPTEARYDCAADALDVEVQTSTALSLHSRLD